MKPKAFQNANPEPLDIIFYSIWTWYWLPDGLLVVEQGLIQLALLLQDRGQVRVCGRKLREHLQRLQVKPCCLLNIPLLPLDVRQIVERVGVRGAQLQCRVVALLRLGHHALLLERVGEVAVGVGEVGLQLDGAPVGVNGQVDKALLVVDAGQVAVHHRMVLAQVQRA